MADLALPLRELEGSLRIPVNVTHFTLTEFRDKWRQGNHFLRTILSEPKIYLKESEHELADALGDSAAKNALHEQAGVG